MLQDQKKHLLASGNWKQSEKNLDQKNSLKKHFWVQDLLSLNKQKNFSFKIASGVQTQECKNQKDKIIRKGQNKELKTKEYTIGSKETKGEVDIVWIVDKSGSMSDDVARVNANLAAFEEKLENFANLKSYLSNKNRWAVQSRNGPACLLASLGLDSSDDNKSNLENLNYPFQSDVKPPPPWFNPFISGPQCSHVTDSLKKFLSQEL